jgi:hypothetical protein
MLIWVDDEQTAKMLEAIEKEFSLEILLKNEERKIIEAERAKVQTALTQLEHIVAVGGNLILAHLMVDATYHESPSRYNNYYGQYIDYARTTAPQSNNGNVPTSSSRPQRSAAAKASARSNAAGNVCLAKNELGQVVRYTHCLDSLMTRVTCPDCSRFDFSNVQGFINHCRIAHKIEYASHEDAVRQCGVKVDLAEFNSDESSRLLQMRPGIQSILNTSSTQSGKLPET